MQTPRFRAFGIALVVLAALTAGCGSSSKSSSDPGTTTPGPCPFNGAMTPETNPGAGTAAATSLLSIQPTVSGCIDQLTFAFNPTLAASSIAYTAGQPQLVVTLKNTTYSGPTTLKTDKLQYVKSISASSSATETQVTLTLDKQRPFLVSTSKVPPELQLSFG
jgi:hypothetical protein